MRFTLATLISTTVLLLLSCTLAQSKPVVSRPESARKYTTVLTVDGGGLKCIIPTMVAIEIENSIKRYLLANPDLLPEDEDIETVDDFDIYLADYFDAMSGVSGGSWNTAYLASKGGNGAARKVLSSRRIRRKYGTILPGQAQGLEVFFMEYGPNFYSRGGPHFNLTVPPRVNVSDLPNFQNISSALTATLGTAAAAATAAATGQAPLQFPFQLPEINIPGVTAPVYPVEGLERALKLFLGNVKLSELSTYYVVHAFDLNAHRNVYFLHDTTERPSVTFTSHAVTRNRPRSSKKDLRDGDLDYEPDNALSEGLDFYVRDIVRASSAIPAMHEAKVLSPIGNSNISYTFVDGATVTNNPALQALIFLSSEPNRIPIHRIAMISLGTGIAYSASEDDADAGFLGWMANGQLFSVIFDGGSENVQSQTDYMFYSNEKVQANQYLRIQVADDRNTTDGDALSNGPTDADHLESLREIGLTAVKRYRAAIDHFVEDFIFGEAEED